MAWNDLDIRDRAAIIRVGVANGLKSIPEIQKAYNKLAEGGDNKTYNSWKKAISKRHNLDLDNDATYDYRGFYNAHPQEAWDMLNKDSDAHFTDEFKTVFHPTFSDESIYSGVVHPRYNPNGYNGGVWGGSKEDGWTYQVKDDSPVSWRDRIDYVSRAENDGVVLLDRNGKWPYVDGAYFGGVLPMVTVAPDKITNKKSLGGNLFDGSGSSEVVPSTGYDPTTYWGSDAAAQYNRYNGTNLNDLVDQREQKIANEYNRWSQYYQAYPGKLPQGYKLLKSENLGEPFYEMPEAVFTAPRNPNAPYVSFEDQEKTRAAQENWEAVNNGSLYSGSRKTPNHIVTKGELVRNIHSGQEAMAKAVGTGAAAVGAAANPMALWGLASNIGKGAFGTMQAMYNAPSAAAELLAGNGTAAALNTLAGTGSGYMGATATAGAAANATRDIIFAAEAAKQFGEDPSLKNGIFTGLTMIPFAHSAGVFNGATPQAQYLFSRGQEVYDDVKRGARVVQRKLKSLNRRTPYNIWRRKENVQAYFKNQEDIEGALIFPANKALEENIPFENYAFAKTALDLDTRVATIEAQQKMGFNGAAYQDGIFTDPFTGIEYPYIGPKTIKNPVEVSQPQLKTALGNRRSSDQLEIITPDPVYGMRGLTDNIQYTPHADTNTGVPKLSAFLEQSVKASPQAKTYRHGDTAALQEGATQYMKGLSQFLGEDPAYSGSLVLARHGMLEQVPGDVEMFVTAEQAEKYAKLLGMPVTTPSRIGNGVLKITGSSKQAAGTGFDLDIVEADSNGNAVGRIAHEIYAALFPTEYAELRTAYAQGIVDSGGYNKLSPEYQKILNSLQTGGSTFNQPLPITPEALLTKYKEGNNALKVQVMNALSVTSQNPKHLKHFDRANNILMNPQATDIYIDAVTAKGKSYIPNYQTVQELYPGMKFDNIEANKELLKALNIDESYASNQNFMKAVAEKLQLDMLVGRNVDAGITSKANYGTVMSNGEKWSIQHNLHTNAASLSASGGGGNHTLGAGGGPRFGNVGILKQFKYREGDVKSPLDLFNKFKASDSESKVSKENLDKINAIFKKYGISPLTNDHVTMLHVDQAFAYEPIEIKSKIAQEIADETDILGYWNYTHGATYADRGTYFGTYSSKPANFGLSLHNYGTEGFELTDNHIYGPLDKSVYRTTSHGNVEWVAPNLSSKDYAKMYELPPLNTPGLEALSSPISRYPKFLYYNAPKDLVRETEQRLLEANPEIWADPADLRLEVGTNLANTLSEGEIQDIWKRALYSRLKTLQTGINSGTNNEYSIRTRSGIGGRTLDWNYNKANIGTVADAIIRHPKLFSGPIKDFAKQGYKHNNYHLRDAVHGGLAGGAIGGILLGAKKVSDWYYSTREEDLQNAINEYNNLSNDVDPVFEGLTQKDLLLLRIRGLENNLSIPEDYRFVPTEQQGASSTKTNKRGSSQKTTKSSRNVRRSPEGAQEESL